MRQILRPQLDLARKIEDRTLTGENKLLVDGFHTLTDGHRS
jgi:hypothetical protein